jgi:hypothetical protein
MKQNLGCCFKNQKMDTKHSDAAPENVALPEEDVVDVPRQAPEDKKASTRFMNAPLAPSTPAELDRLVQSLKLRYAHLFKNDEQFEFFCMLPLDEEQREDLIQKMLNPNKKRRGLGT